MRIATWNMNQARQTLPRLDAWAFLLGLDPDIALLQEAIIPEDVPDVYRVLWQEALQGGAWGSAILSRVGGSEPDWQRCSREGVVVMARATTPSLGSFSIASVHARVVNHRVIPAVRTLLEDVRPRLRQRFIVGGDLNTARQAALAWPDNGHREFWADVETWGLHEALPPGGERQSFWRDWSRNRPPSLGNTLQDDHVFMDAETYRLVKETVVWDTREVRGLSDHGPVVVDLDL